MDNYITLKHLDQTVWSLIQKNNQLRDEISAVDIKVDNIETQVDNIRIEESDPVFSTSPAATITNDDISNWNNKPTTATINDTVTTAINNLNLTSTYIKKNTELFGVSSVYDVYTVDENVVGAYWRLNGNAVYGARYYKDPQKYEIFMGLKGEHNNVSTYLYNIVTPTSNTMAANKLYVDTTVANAIAGITSFNASVVTTLPTTNIDTHTIYFISKTGSTNDVYDEYMYINNTWEKIGNTAVDLSGYLRSTDIADWAKASTKPSYTASEVGALDYIGSQATSVDGTTITYAYTLKDGTKSLDVPVYKTSPESYRDMVTKEYVDTAISGITVPTKVSSLTNDAGYITSYTETDPVFAASAAAGITSTDISNWNAKVSDDKTWNGISLANGNILGNSTSYVPAKMNDKNNDNGSMYFLPMSHIPTANYGVKYDASAYLNSTTPAATDNSTKVATTAYVTTAISNAATAVTQTLTSGTAIATINGTTIYAPSYTDADGVSY